MDELLRPLGLTTPQYNVLSAIEHTPGISNASLARGVFVTAQSMVGLVINLERTGLIHRTDDPSHGRVKRAELTREGATVLAKAHVLLADVDKRMMSGFSQNERDDLQRSLRTCVRNLGDPSV
jgi:DNA-binding MarR family transcriptional regulator